MTRFTAENAGGAEGILDVSRDRQAADGFLKCNAVDAEGIFLHVLRVLCGNP